MNLFLLNKHIMWIHKTLSSNYNFNFSRISYLGICSLVVVGTMMQFIETYWKGRGEGKAQKDFLPQWYKTNEVVESASRQQPRPGFSYLNL